MAMEQLQYLYRARESKNYIEAENRLQEFAQRWLDPKWKNINGHVKINLQPLLDIHNETGLRHDEETVSRSTIYFFGLIAIFILFIAWINYVNLCTARAMERSREVGIKKTIGASRSELIMQFLFESIAINIIAVALAVILAMLLLPVLSDMIGKQLPTHLNDTRFREVLAVLFVVGTLASGVYPAFVMSSFRITKAIKKVSDKGFSLRKGLVVFQFVSSLVLIAGTFVVNRQITFMRSRDTGLQMDQMLIIDAPGTLEWSVAQKTLAIYKEEAKKIPGVESITTSGAVPAGGYNWGADIRKLGEPETSNTLGCIVYVDHDFIPAYNIDLIAGHNYNPDAASDKRSVIINEAALKAFKLGTPEEALTQRLILEDTLDIAGVAKDSNWNSLKSDFTPFVFVPETIMPVKVSVHLKSGSIPATIDALDKLYRSLMHNDPFEYNFLDDSFNRQYKADQQFGNIFGMFAGLAIAICCLGLWGLSSFTTSQKLKEIGIRKVLGASVQKHCIPARSSVRATHRAGSLNCSTSCLVWNGQMAQRVCISGWNWMGAFCCSYNKTGRDCVDDYRFAGQAWCGYEPGGRTSIRMIFGPIICLRMPIFVSRFFKLEKAQTHPFLLCPDCRYTCCCADGIGICFQGSDHQSIYPRSQ